MAGRDEPRLVLPAAAFVDLEAAAEQVHTADSANAMGDWHRAWAPARGALHTAERAGRALIEASPFHEAGYLHLMRALAARGNVAEALLVHDRLRTSLRDQLGIAPSPRVQELHATLLRSR